jgi:3-deoxy-7-phosphoheptulonate synthase
MFILLDAAADPGRVESGLRSLGQWVEPHVDSDGSLRGFSVAPHSVQVDVGELRRLEGVRDVLAASSAHPRVDSRAGLPVEAGRLQLGVGRPVLMAGPCSVESEVQIDAAAAMVAAAGGQVLRGGAFKPRTSPYAFAGHGREALVWLRRAADAHGLAVVAEVLSEADVELVAEYADILQIGSRNMQAFALLRAVGRAGVPVLLKRGFAARIEEWLLAGEYLLDAGADGVVFCERGMRSADPQTRNVLDLAGAALVRHVYGQPVVVDPSHAAGRRDLVPFLVRAAIAADLDGVLVEAHPNPGASVTDAPQALGPQDLAELGWVIGPAGETTLRRREAPPTH